eukprot:1157205-Pelagomonas_calceolata.AAC.6
MLHTGAKAKAGRQQLLAIAGLACAGHARQVFPEDTAPLLWVSRGRLSRRGLIQGREKQDEVGWGASDHSLFELSLKTLNFTTTRHRTPSK